MEDGEELRVTEAEGQGGGKVVEGRGGRHTLVDAEIGERSKLKGNCGTSRRSDKGDGRTFNIGALLRLEELRTRLMEANKEQPIKPIKRCRLEEADYAEVIAVDYGD